MKKLAIIGTGSAGVLSLCHFLSYLSNEWEVYSIHDPKKPILGIGESTNPTFVLSLDKAIQFNYLQNGNEIDATPKYATVFKNWRQDNFYHPLVGGNHAVHMNSFKLFKSVFPKLKNKFGNKLKKILGNVQTIINKKDYVECNINNKTYKFDYVMECTGFPKDYTDYNICNLPVNSCLVHNIDKPGDWEYTGHVATKNGWMFEIPLTTRQSYGYLYNDKITTKDEAKKDFSKEIKVPIKELQNIEYHFKSYYAKQFLNGRIIKNGNAAIFFEPMSAFSLFLYDKINRSFFDYLLIEDVREQKMLNIGLDEVAKETEAMIAYMYHGGSLHNTKFWKYAKKITKPIVFNSNIFKEIQTAFKQEYKKGTPLGVKDWVFCSNDLLKIDRNFGYNYFSSKSL